jgi:gluconate kinase
VARPEDVCYSLADWRSSVLVVCSSIRRQARDLSLPRFGQHGSTQIR